MVIYKSAIIQYCLLYMMLLTQSSGLLMSIGENWIYIYIAISALILLHHARENHTKFLITLAVIEFSIILTRYLVGGVGTLVLFTISAKILFGYTAVLFDRENCATRYVRLSSFLAVISIIHWGVINLNKNLLTVLLPSSVGHGEAVIFRYNPFFCYNANGIYDEILRNNGIYTEPTLMAIQILAAIFILFYLKDSLTITEKEWKKHVFISLAALITSFSTTGFITLIITVVVYVCINDYDQDIKTRVVLFSILIVIVAVVDVTANGEDGLVYKFLLSKTTSISVSGQRVIDLSANTGIARISVIESAIQVIPKYPLGCGYDYFNDYLMRYSEMGAQSAGGGLFKELAVLGIFPILSIILYMSSCVKRLNIKGARLIYFLIVIITTMAESTLFYSVFIMVAAICYFSCLNDNEMNT